MISTTLVVLMLGVHGGEPAREVKFQGALLAQADVVPPPAPTSFDATVSAAAVQKEVDALLAARPGFVAPTVLLTIGGVLFSIGATAVILGIAAGAGIFLALGLAVALFAGVPALITIVIGAVLAGVRQGERNAIDARVQTLRQSIGKPESGRGSSMPAGAEGLLVPTATNVLFTF